MNPQPPRTSYVDVGPPDRDGTIGSAWRQHGVPAEGLDPKDDRIVCEWLLWCPLVSPRRQHWLLVTASLLPSPIATIPRFAAGATHELTIIALNEQAPLRPREAGGLTLVDPPELAYQFAASSDYYARQFADEVAEGVCTGTIFPEPGSIGGSGQYHGETLTKLLEQVDRAWHLTRSGRPSPVLKQAERREKFWTITRSSLGGVTLKSI